jgi:hypothetical protein
MGIKILRSSRRYVFAADVRFDLIAAALDAAPQMAAMCHNRS